MSTTHKPKTITPHTLRLKEALDSVEDARKLLQQAGHPEDAVLGQFQFYVEECLAQARSKLATIIRHS